jgi:hypothetical protein
MSKGGEASDHFVDNTSEAPPIYCFIVALLLDDFWRQIFRRAADGHCLFIFEVERAGEAEIGDLDVTGLIKEDVFGFETEWLGEYSR